MSNSFSLSPIVYEKNAFSTPFLSGYRLLRIPILDGAGNPTWPDKFPLEKIQQLRQTVGQRHFSSQMMLEFVPPNRLRLDPGDLNLYNTEFDPHTARISSHQITGCSIYWDPSSGRRQSDNSVCVLIYRDDKTHCVFIHDILYMHVPDDATHPLSSQCDMVLDFISHHHVSRIAIETNGLGNALPEIMRDTATRRGIRASVLKITNHTPKADRILDSIEPLLTSGRLYAHTRLQHTPLISEMLGWSPIGCRTHDDGLDAVAGAICTTPISVRPYGIATRPIRANTSFSV
ncbi:MAG: hypothetical protein IKV93_00655 [Alphaproteobacteria bacterium]|nr:hypothetical protein [Alphaproteobacteria bacterium]